MKTLADVEVLRRQHRFAEAVAIFDLVLEGPERQTALDYGCMLMTDWGCWYPDLTEAEREQQVAQVVARGLD
jgi:hypothetical protein